MDNPRHKVIHSLKITLEAGYQLLEQRNIFKTPRIPRSWEPGFDPRDNNFGRAIRQLAYAGDFTAWEAQLKIIFDSNDLSWLRFRRVTEDYDEKVENYSDAANFKRKIDELDKIVHDPALFDKYILPPTNPTVSFADGILTQGYHSHKFNEDQAAKLIELLWDGRRIVTDEGSILKGEHSIDREAVYSSLKISHPRFLTIVRNIHTSANRKAIKVKVKFPKSYPGVFLEVVQDFM